MSRQVVLSLWIGLLALPGVGLAAPSQPAETTGTKVDVVDLAAVFEWVHHSIESQQWRRPAWDAADLEQWLLRLVGQVRQAGGRYQALPVRLTALRERTDASQISMLTQALYVGKGTAVDCAERSILLVDGHVKIAHANDCIIVARGVVEINHSSRNIVIAGDYLEISYDGTAERIDHGSLLLSGGIASVFQARGSQLGAPQLVNVGIAANCSFINSPTCTVEQKRGTSRELKLPELRTDPGTQPSWFKQIQVQSSSPQKGVSFLWQGKEYRARRDTGIVAADGKPAAAFAGWQISHLSTEYVRFQKGRESFGLWLGP